MAGRLLGWRPDEFWRSTPAELLGALHEPQEGLSGPARDTIASMLERDGHG
ncbi:MAG: phage tail assembly chaperone [Erythrobacter sp.]|nr:phage tail assembly chaperone [Erythrobacter sp.]